MLVALVLAFLTLLFAVTIVGRGTPSPVPNPIVFPAGTEIPFRLLHEIQAGKDHAGTEVYAQTLGALVRDSCVIVPPFLAVRGRITESHRGWFGARSELTMRFDSVELAPADFAPFDALADSLEYLAPGAIGDSGQIYAGRARTGGRVAAAALAKTGLTAAGLAVVPVDAVDGYLLFRRPAPVRLLAGEVGRLRLLAPLAVPEPPACDRVDTNADLATPALPPFVPRTSNSSGTVAGDPINFVFFGTLEALDTAFARAGWARAHASTAGALAKEAEAAVRKRPAAVGAPVSTQYFEGRPEDVAYELAGPNARVRHHIRAWRLEDTLEVLVGSADHDIGLDINPVRGRTTHRVDPDIDRERDYIVVQLEAGGCANLLEVVLLPGAATDVKNAAAQQLVTDGRSAVIQIRECWLSPD